MRKILIAVFIYVLKQVNKSEILSNVTFLERRITLSVEKILMQQLQSDGSYNQLYPKTDSYTKSETLSSETSSLFGIENGSPEDVFKWIGKYNQYWWEKSEFTISHYEQVMTDITESVWLNGSDDSTPGVYFVWCAKSINVDANGKMSPADGGPQIISADNTNATQLKSWAPCYLFVGRAKGTEDKPYTAVYYLPSGSTAGNGTAYTVNGNTRYTISLSASASVKAKLVTQKLVTGQTTNTVLVSSKEKDAYSNDGDISSKSIVTGDSFQFDFVDGVSQNNTVNVTVLTNVAINESTGELTYSTGDSGSLRYGSYAFYTNYCKGNYIKLSTSGITSSYYGIQDNNSELIFYVPSNGSISRLSKQDNPNSFTYYYHLYFTVQPVYIKETQLRDGNYTLLGNPFESFEYNAKIQQGTYIGTGTYGESNKNSIVFPFAPKYVFSSRGTNSSTISSNSGMFFIGQPGSTGGCSFSVNDNTLYWYSTNSAAYQQNISNETYYYMGVGE